MRARHKRGCFEVIVGKSILEFRREDPVDPQVEKSTKCFGFVQTYDEKPRRWVFEVLKSQDLAMNQQVTFVSDGEDDVRKVQQYLSPEAEYWLDWFHITMRITVMKRRQRPQPRPLTTAIISRTTFDGRRIIEKTSGIALPVSPTGVMNVVTAVITAKGNEQMKQFTIDNDNNITLHASVQDAEAVTIAEQFSTAAGLAKLAHKWPAARLVEIWNRLPGVSPVKKFTDRKTAATRIWKQIQSLGETAAAKDGNLARGSSSHRTCC